MILYEVDHVRRIHHEQARHDLVAWLDLERELDRRRIGNIPKPPLPPDAVDRLERLDRLARIANSVRREVVVPFLHEVRGADLRQRGVEVPSLAVEAEPR